MKKIAIAIPALLLTGLAVWLWRIMPLQAWGEWNGQTYALVAEGWEVLYRGWPLALLGALVAGFLLWGLFTWGFSQVVDAEHENALRRLRSEVEHHKAASEAARGVAEADLSHRVAEAEKARLEAHRASQEAYRLQVQANEQIEEARERVRVADQTASEAARRAKNAIMTLRRKTGT